LVVCEGARTEPEYIKGFEREARNAAVTVQIPKKRGDPLNLVKLAVRLTKNADDRARREADPGLKFDEVWCVFDGDVPARLEAARTLAVSNRFGLVISNPCIELWLILHFRENPGPQTSAHLLSLLREFLTHYDKGIDFRDFAGKTEDAANRARRLDERARGEGEPGRNPTTDMFRLVDSISRA